MSADPAPSADPPAPSWARPTRLSEAAYHTKVAAFRARRLALDLAAGPVRLSRDDGAALVQIVGESRTPLMADVGPAERDFQLGKIQNLRLACRALDDLVIPAGEVFSFWRQVGPPLPSRGYVRGRMLQEGCMVAATGGGLCQLSNALYDVALQAGCRIIERHPHSRVVPGSAAARGRDATVAWNYVDLRFAPQDDLRLSARLERDSLVVTLAAALNGPDRRSSTPQPEAPEPTTPAWASPRSCATCDEADCHLHQREHRRPSRGERVQAFLVDEAWPEFRAHVGTAHGPGDRLGCSIGGARGGWRLAGFERTTSAPLSAARRSLAIRTAANGAGVRRADLERTEAIARRLARLLTHDVTAVTVAQSYLPFLWRDGWLGGREVSVLMTRLPMDALQARLDAAAERRPERSLSDFRAPEWLPRAEAEALAACDHVITPHAEIAALFGDRTVRTPWVSPAPQRRGPGDHGGRIVFPGPTVARKGAFAVREAAIALHLEVAPLGTALEGAGFWRGVRIAAPGDWMDADVVVQPAVVEHAPRRLLAALAAGLPVIASPACGLDPQLGLTLVPPDDGPALIEALKRVLAIAP